MRGTEVVTLFAFIFFVGFFIGFIVGYVVGLEKPTTCSLPDVLTIESGDGKKTARCVDGRGEVVR